MLVFPLERAKTPGRRSTVPSAIIHFKSRSRPTPSTWESRGEGAERTTSRHANQARTENGRGRTKMRVGCSPVSVAGPVEVASLVTTLDGTEDTRLELSSDKLAEPGTEEATEGADETTDVAREVDREIGAVLKRLELSTEDAADTENDETKLELGATLKLVRLEEDRADDDSTEIPLEKEAGALLGSESDALLGVEMIVEGAALLSGWVKDEVNAAEAEDVSRRANTPCSPEVNFIVSKQPLDGVAPLEPSSY
ncbi:hypothetical protein NM688_g206 [Phlebia brevispora]|uniref:Uncharacterized protein n=1 Tax=Phlebia brevispora TaxID=194682 RepID=A0ACC1TEZ6_9APHY|nr:hypothetical protein NM688_g206 [Phlebia brevispora]